MKIVYANSGDDLLRIKSLGFDTVLGSFSVDEMNLMTVMGLSCISHDYIDHPAVIAFYLFDEPDAQGISIADQDARIDEYRAKTDKPLCVAVTEEIERKCSDRFDWYMMDIYYSNKYSKLVNYLNIAISPHFLKVLYKGKKLIPIMGLYDDLAPFVFTPEIYPFARKFRSYFRTEDQAIFTWEGDQTTCWGIIDRPEYITWSSILNKTSDNCWKITSFTLTALARLIIKINPLLGRWKIMIGNI